MPHSQSKIRASLFLGGSFQNSHHVHMCSTPCTGNYKNFPVSPATDITIEAPHRIHDLSRKVSVRVYVSYVVCKNVLCMKYRISSNNSRGRLFLFSHQKGAIIRGRRLFQIFLTGGRALNMLFYYTIHIKYKPNMGFLSVSKMARREAIIRGRRLL